MTDLFAGPRIAPLGFTSSPLDRADARARWLVFDDLKPVLTEAGDPLWAYRSDVPHDALSVFLRFGGEAPRFAAVAAAADIAGAPIDIVGFQRAAAVLPIEERPAMAEWIERFNAGVSRLGA